MNRHRLNWIESLIFVIVIAIVWMMLSGCGVFTPRPVDPVPTHHTVPPSLKATNVSLDWLITLSVVAVGGGAGLFFLVPAFHKISGLMLAIGGGILGVALILKTTLWLIPYIAGIALITGVAFLLYELYGVYKQAHATLPKQG